MGFPQFQNINSNNLGLISECPLCKAKSLDLNIVEDTNSGYLIHSKCKKCNNAMLLIVVANEIGMNVVGMNTELSLAEFIKIRNKNNVVEIDDVIAANSEIRKGEFIKQLI